MDPDSWSDMPQQVIDEIAAINEGDLLIDASSANEVSAQIAQLLVSIQTTLAQRSSKLSIINPTQGVCEAMNLLGFSHLLPEANNDT